MKKVQTRQEILDILRQYRLELSQRFGVTDIAVFGSYARDRHNRRSDIDILVDLEQTRKNFDNYMELKFFLQRHTGGTIDLVLKESLRNELKPNILREAVYA